MENQILIASEGMWLTNGETYGKTVTMPPLADASAWYEITEEEKLKREEIEYENQLESTD